MNVCVPIDLIPTRLRSSPYFTVSRLSMSYLIPNFVSCIYLGLQFVVVNPSVRKVETLQRITYVSRRFRGVSTF